MRPVIFGPWTGEFGWELCFWQGRVRRLCNTTYRNYKKIAISYPGHDVLYDKVDQFIPLPEFFVDTVRNKTTIQCMGGTHGSPQTYAHLMQWVRDMSGIVVDYNHQEFPTNINHRLQDQDLTRLTSGSPRYMGPMICLLPRHRPHEQFRNWSTEKWIALAEMLVRDGFRVIVMGSNESGNTKVVGSGIENLTGQLTLREQIRYIESSKLGITSFCGAIRLLSLVGCPILTFGEKNFVETVNRRESNALSQTYFSTPICLYTKPDSWEFSAVEVHDRIKTCL